MILSQRQLEEIAASTTKDFNRFFFGDEADKPDRSALPTPIDQFAKNYLGLRVSFARLSPDGSICGVTAYADTEYKITELGITRTLALKRNQVILDESFIRSGNVQRLCAKRRFTLAHECAHQILFQLESEEVKASCEMKYSARTAYTPRELKTREDWNEWQANGYRWDEEHSNMVFDEETAPIVQKIFQWKIEGLSLPAIADRLDAMNAPNPEFQKYQVGVRTGNATAKKIWNKSSLTSILDNPHYVGDTVLGRTLNAIYKGVKNQHINREEWIVFPNTHEAIISREDFQKVRELRDAAARTRVEKMERTEEIRATLINLFEDKIVCADCGRKLYFHRKRVDKRKDGAWYAFYECSSSVKRGNLCTLHYTRQDKLEADVLAAIQLQVKAALNYDKLLAKLRNSEGERSIRDQQNALITSLNLKLSGISKKRTRLYEDFTEGILDEEEYVFAKKAYDEQYANLSRRLDEAVQRKVKFVEAMSEDNKWLTLMKSVSGATMLSQELVDESVELVKVHEDGSIELVMKYGDIYALTVQSIKEVQEAM